MSSDKILRYAELVINPCSRTYGSAPCTAAVGVTGDFKCYNSPRTCQDPANYLAGDDQVIRWAMPTSDLPIEIDAIPCVQSINTRPLVIAPAEGLGVRESVTVTMHNFLHNDVGFDNYIPDRGYNTYNKGTFWGKFFARWGSLQGYEFRVVDGVLGQSINDMVRRYYVVDTVSPVSSAGTVSFTVKDVMKFMDEDRAQLPRPSAGSLAADLTDVATSFTLSPASIGSTYPASGVASIGDEKVTFTRSGDTITLTGRGLSGSPQEEHDEGETFQIAQTYTNQDPATIINDILTAGTEIPADYIDLAAWQDEVNNYIGRVYSAEVMRPTSVKKLIEELCVDCGITFFVDIPAKSIVLKVLRQEVPVRSLTDDSILAGQIRQKVLSDSRVSELWVYYGKKNPLEKQNETKNYSAVFAALGTNNIAALENVTSAIRSIHSRWITTFNISAVESISDKILARYQRAPRRINLKARDTVPVRTGDTITVQSRVFEDSQGDLEAPINCQVISLEESNGVYSISAEEVNFGETVPSDPSLRIIEITSEVFNLNLRNVHDSIYTPVQSGQTVRFIFTARVGSEDTTRPAIDTGFWPAGVILEIDGDSGIHGAGGKGGNVSDGDDGGLALKVRYALEIKGTLDIFGGGGGGGAGEFPLGNPAVGGGGAGIVAGGTGATYLLGSFQPSGPYAGKGGDVGQAGASTGFFNGGAAGLSIDGAAFVTITGTPNIIGAQV